jgi:hypothetical protein
MTTNPFSKTTAISSAWSERSMPPVIFQRPLSLESGQGCACEGAPDVTAGGVALLHAVERVMAEDEPPRFACQVALGEDELRGLSGHEREDIDYARLAETASLACWRLPP